MTLNCENYFLFESECVILLYNRGDIMEKIILASNNAHKVDEFKKLFSDFEVLTMTEIGFHDEIDETGKTFFENSLIKAKAVSDFCKKKGIVASVIADDSGLCVDALGGAPGVYTARYGGDHDPVAGRKRLLENLKGIKNRKAYYECSIVKMAPDGSYVHAQGKTFGVITEEERGDKGMTFDRLFLSDDLHKTFAEVSTEEKNSVSHRARAIDDLKSKWNVCGRNK